MADTFSSFDAILFKAALGRAPSIVSLLTSEASFIDSHGLQAGGNVARVPHPEVYMDFLAENLRLRAWRHQLVEALDGMNKKFTCPYIIFFPVISHDGMPFPINRIIQEMQGSMFVKEYAWRGDIVVAKYSDGHFSQITNASMADYPILKNYLSTHASPIKRCPVK
ncbi:hypothetical protein BV25DRAFT_1873060 [Artomyces pyxidatus]|uniref:Uncharacterized protein n=1 Tax=Artomyces pyxidatus TaxID=48021 RepID=A0ACB8SGM7_9AGAM|nr:hypothetical protein BV25DRAFT_1873060 [Artomyces pyxidatus]